MGRQQEKIRVLYGIVKYKDSHRLKDLGVKDLVKSSNPIHLGQKLFREALGSCW